MNDAVTPARIEELKQALLSFLTRLAETAQGAQEKLRALLVISLLSALWLTFCVHRLFDLSALGAVAPLIVFAVPAFLVWRLQRTLRDVSGLPEQLSALGDGIGRMLADAKGDMLGRLDALKAQANGRVGLKALVAMGRRLAGIGQVLAVLKVRLVDGGSARVVESVLTVASPAFVALIGIATVGTVALAILAVVSGIAYLFIA